MKRITTLVLFFAGLTFLSSCIKEKSLENGTGTPATGSLQNDLSGECLSKTVSGIFEAGTALDDTHSIDIDLVVTGAGSYTITTDTINGYYFKAVGNFGSVGAQTVRLIGIGTPTAPGTDQFTISFDGSSCTVEVSVLPNGAAGPATFTLEGAGGGCTNASLSGNYITGIALNNSNKVSLSVNVSTIGSYNVTTTNANGISFSGTGVLTATGMQEIVLKASGTPVAAGTTQLSVTVGAGTCSFDVPVTGPAEFTFDCNSAQGNGVIMAGVTLSNVSISIDVNVTAAGPYSISSSIVNGISFSGSGQLALGQQTIVLSGSGTPVAAGDFDYPISFGSSGCNFQITVDAAPQIDWKFTANGVTYQGTSDLVDLIPVSGFSTFSLFGTEVNGGDFSLALLDMGGGINANETYTSSGTITNQLHFTFQYGNNKSYTSDLTTPSAVVTAKVISHNTGSKQIEGTFSGSALNELGNKITITNGSFKATYQ